MSPASRCAVCGKPIVWAPLVGWTHLTLDDLDHDAEEKR